MPVQINMTTQQMHREDIGSSDEVDIKMLKEVEVQYLKKKKLVSKREKHTGRTGWTEESKGVHIQWADEVV